MNSNKIEAIKEILKSEYGDKISDVTLNSYARALYYSLFVGQYDLSDITAIIFEFESEENLEEGDWCGMFGELIRLLDDNEVTANRLYNSFMHDFDLLDTVVKLLTRNAQFLSEEQIKKAKEKAFGVFDAVTLECYGITE